MVPKRVHRTRRLPTILGLTLTLTLALILSSPRPASAFPQTHAAPSPLSPPSLSPPDLPAPQLSPLTPHRFFFLGLEPCGPQPPTPTQTARFEALLLDAAPLRDQPLCQLFEAFLLRQPQSPYAPTLHLALGRHYAQSCRLQSARHHFTQAWNLTQHLQDPHGRRLADHALVHLGELLVSLGHLDDLQPLLPAAAHRPLDGSLLSARWLQVQSLRRTLASHPDAHPHCGILSLLTLATALGASDILPDSLLSLPAALTASSLADLQTLARHLGLPTTPVQRHDPQLIPVPSLIHFQAGHFATVLDHADQRFAVADPALSHTLWLTGEELNQEASGLFLVPQSFQHPDFSPLDPAHAASVHGRSVMVAYYRDREACPCEDCHCPGASAPPLGLALPNPSPSPASLHPANLGSATGLPFLSSPRHQLSASVPQPRFPHPLTPHQPGLITWHVSEPELNLWLSDTPLAYQPARGPALILKLDYRQRNLDSIPHLNTYGGTSFGAGWHASWIAWADERLVYLPGGQQLDFSYPANSDLSHPDFHYHARQRRLRLPNGQLAGYALLWPDGSSLEFRHPSANPFAPFFLTAQIDPHGDRLQFAYRNHRLDTITDADGAQTTLGYHSLHPNLVSWVLAPGQRLIQFEPDPTSPAGYLPRLRAITRGEQLRSSIDYDAHGSPRAIHTPYGTTSFQLDQALRGRHGWWLDRKITVTQPTGNIHLYAAAFSQHPDLPDTFLASQLPRNLPHSSAAHPHGTLQTLQRASRNTFYLGPLQVAAAHGATDLQNFSWGSDSQPGHLRKTRIRHWLLRQHLASLHSSSLNHQQNPSPNGITQGAITWFDYPGKSTSSKAFAGTHNLPSLIVQLPTTPQQPAYHHWIRNPLGHPLSLTSTWTTPSGQWSTRSRSFTYDPLNQIDLLSQTDYQGRLTHQFSYDPHHRLTQARAHPQPNLSYSTRFAYDTLGRLASLTSPSGLVQSRSYGADGRLATLAEPAIGRSEQFSWRHGLLRSHTDARGLRRTFTHDSLGRLTRIDYPDGTHEAFSYTGTLGPRSAQPHLSLTQTRNRQGRLTRFEYDPQARLIQIRDPLGRSTRLEYCACDAISSLIDPLGRRTRYQHDFQGNLTSILYPQPDGRLRLDFTHNPYGQVLSQTDGDGLRLNFTYNHQGLLSRVQSPAGTLSAFRYDPDDQPVQLTLAHGATLQQSFDALGRLLLRQYPDGSRLSFEYSPAGLIATTDPNGHRTLRSLDPAGRLRSLTNPNGHLIRLAYHPAGDLLQLTDPQGRHTRWQYDREGRWTNKINQTGHSILTARYDPQGRLIQRWSAAKGTTAYTYDPVGNLTRITYPSQPAVHFTYDALDRLVSFSDSAFGTTALAYLPGGQLHSVSGPWDRDTLTYAYTPGGRRRSLQLQQPTGHWSQTYAYDSAGRLASLQSPAGSFAYRYPSNPSDLWHRLDLPGQTAIRRTHDPLGRLTRTELLDPQGRLLNAHAYGYQSFQRRWMQRTDHSRVDYHYDPAGQLLRARGSGGLSPENLTYTYDPNGNLLSRSQGALTESFSYNARNELLSTPHATCSYDPNGNLRRQSFTPDGSRFLDYTYDDELRLASVSTDYYGTPPDQRWRAEFLYDALGRLRVRRDFIAPNGFWQPSGQSRFLYDGPLPLQERSAANLPVLTFTRGLDLAADLHAAGGIGALLAQSTQYSPTTGAWAHHDLPHADASGNITFLLRPNPALNGSFRYDPFGNLIHAAGRGPAPLLFSSKPRHPNSGLYHFGLRFYDPNLQRWLNPDPLGEAGGLNLYAFVHNDPINRTDSFGLFGTGWMAYIDSLYGCCNGQPYTLASQCCRNGQILDKIPRHQKLGLSFEQCVGGETLLGANAQMLAEIGGLGSALAAAKWSAFRTGWAGPMVLYGPLFYAGFAIGDKLQAAEYCNELLCP